jgi:aminopeptidase N
MLITVEDKFKTLSNGLLISSKKDGKGLRTDVWEMKLPHSPYLFMMAVGEFAVVKDSWNGMLLEYYVEPKFEKDAKNIFPYTAEMLSFFSERFGVKYPWQKYSQIVVRDYVSGAMENTTAVIFGDFVQNDSRSIMDNSDMNEGIVAHEMMHHWFGDLVTCSTAEDMWLNEGWASFSAFIFTESLYGKEAYKNELRSNQAKILQFAHVKEGGYRAVSGIPHEWTYGDHVYLKGAAIAHTIRGYMGDSLFFLAVKNYLSENAFGDVDSDKMRNDFETISGLDLSDCFNNWVFNPGYAHFSIDSFSVNSVGGNFNVELFVKQKLTGAPNLYTNVPLEVTFMNNAFSSYTTKIMMSGQTASFNINVPFLPTYAGLNHELKISDAIVSQYKTIKTTGTHNMPDLKINFNITAITDSTFLRVEHNFTAHDPLNIGSGYTISPNRYYKIDGIFSAGFKGIATINYDGRSTTPSTNQFLDNLLFSSVLNEDSLVLLYRKSAAEQWALYPYFTKVMNNVNDKYGTIKIDSIQKGEYALAMKSGITGIEKKISANKLKLIPNPAKDKVVVDLTNFPKSENIIECCIINNEGKWIRNYKIAAHATNFEIDLNGLSNGLYYLTFNDGLSFENSKLMINK